MSDMINKEDNRDVIGHGEKTAKPVVKMENTLKQSQARVKRFTLQSKSQIRVLVQEILL